MTPEETWHAVTRQVGRVNGLAAIEASRGGELHQSDFEAMHRAIFEPVFGEKALRVRTYHERVEYGIVLGARERPEHKPQRGISPKSLPKTLKATARDLNKAFAARDKAVSSGRSRKVIDATRPATRAYSRFLADHPFMDGNARTASPLLGFALVRLGLLTVAVQDTEDFQWCLGQAMHRHRRRDVEPLSEYLANLIQTADNRGE
jgi:fido (protein-threonine AMPylation protein)